MPRRYVPWSEKGICPEAVQEKGLNRGEVARGIFLGIKDESEIAVVGTPHGLVFREKFAEFQKRILEMVCYSTASEEPHGNCNLELKEVS